MKCFPLCKNTTLKSQFFKHEKKLIFKCLHFTSSKVVHKIQKVKISYEPYIKMEKKIKKAIEWEETGNKVLQTTAKKVKE